MKWLEIVCGFEDVWWLISFHLSTFPALYCAFLKSCLAFLYCRLSCSTSSFCKSGFAFDFTFFKLSTWVFSYCLPVFPFFLIFYTPLVQFFEPLSFAFDFNSLISLLRFFHFVCLILAFFLTYLLLHFLFHNLSFIFNFTFSCFFPAFNFVWLISKLLLLLHFFIS